MAQLQTLADFEKEAARFARSLAPGGECATLVTFSGDLGAGKTAFVKAAARALGVDAPVTSPTFVLEKIYQLPAGQPFARLVHVDAYRLSSGTELAPLGFEEIMREPGNLVMLEWPERVADALPAPTVRATIAALDTGARTISYA